MAPSGALVLECFLVFCFFFSFFLLSSILHQTCISQEPQRSLNLSSMIPALHISCPSASLTIFSAISEVIIGKLYCDVLDVSQFLLHVLLLGNLLDFALQVIYYLPFFLVHYFQASFCFSGKSVIEMPIFAYSLSIACSIRQISMSIAHGTSSGSNDFVR